MSPSVVSPTISSHRKQLQATTSTAQVKSEELQSQLDELDRYIAQLTQNMEDLGTGDWCLLVVLAETTSKVLPNAPIIGDSSNGKVRLNV